MTTYTARVIGSIWQPGMGTCATSYTLIADSDSDAIDSVEAQAGDFSQVEDFQLERIMSPVWREIVSSWARDASEVIYWDCMDREFEIIGDAS